MVDLDVRRVDFGWFVRPGAETDTGQPRVEPVLGYLVTHPGGLLLFDTGMGSRADVDAHYRPRAVGLRDALSAHGIRLDAVTEVTNCHLHFDHCGGNPLVADLPTFVQRTELATAQATTDYTLPELVAGSRYVVLDGEAQVLPGVLLVPTPGHTDGHQSLVVRRSDGVVVVAGQSHDSASAYGADMLAWQARQAAHPDPLPVHPDWVARLQELDPQWVYFAHDHSIWRP
ncbi:MAG: MBL fold metallo-hydrolase [Actinomycetota bacterium]|nr:MBL fold metallo-hydrolase [Actinomycetota bacterium]